MDCSAGVGPTAFSLTMFTLKTSTQGAQVCVY